VYLQDIRKLAAFSESRPGANHDNYFLAAQTGSATPRQLNRSGTVKRSMASMLVEFW
jgi:hypothetical protein